VNAPIELSPAEAVALGAESLVLFGQVFLPKTFRQTSPAMHHDMAAMLYAPTRYNEFLCFRGSAKTTLLRAFTLQRIAYGISRTIMYTSSSQGHAIHSIRWLKRQIESNPRLSPFGLRQGSKWTDEWIEIAHEVEGHTINVFAVGITGQIRGFNLDDYRPDLIIADDVLDEENTATKEQRGKVADRFMGALINSLAPASEAPRAKAVLAQTPFNRYDLAMLCAADPQWNNRKYSVFDENGESRWAQRFPTAELKVEKAGAIARGMYRNWMREWECEVVIDEIQPFDVEKLQYWSALPDDMTKVLTIDPASSDSRKADQNVVMVVGARGKDFYVCGYHAAQAMDPGKTSAKFFELAMAHAPLQRAGVEAVAYQRTLKWHIEQEMQRRRLWVPLQEIKATERKSNRIIAAIAGILNYGHLHIHHSMVELVTQLDMYNPEDPDAEDDILDALAMGIVMLNPALRAYAGLDTEAIEGEFSVMDEREYQTVRLAACP
jgi:hypothetical protein